MKEDILCLREMGTGRKWCAQPFPENEKAEFMILEKMKPCFLRHSKPLKTKGVKTNMMKKKMNTVLALSAICWLSFAGIVSAGSASNTIAGVKIHANTILLESGATASTAAETYDYGVIARVSSTYVASKFDTGESYTDHQCVEGNSSASNGYTAPMGYRSLSIKADHFASKNNETWSIKTQAVRQ